jgi:hypothetical protein
MLRVYVDPRYEGKQVIVAYSGGEPPASMAFLRLVVPGDVHGRRSVRDVATIELPIVCNVRFGHKPTLFTASFYVCFTPESGHLGAHATERL